MGMPFIDLGEQYRRIERDVRERIDNVLAHGKYIMGPEVAELEAELADFCGAKHAISCASGTDALLLPLMAWGIGPGDAVFVPPFTFFATAEVVSLLGATPVFVDVDPVTYCMDPDRLEAAILAVEKNDSSIHPLPRLDDGFRLKPRVIIPVDLFGIPAQYEKILPLAERYGLKVLEDAAQAFGGKAAGKRSCSLGCHASATSFFPAKPLGCYGDGGAIFTDDSELDQVFRSLRVHGKGGDKYDNVRIGLNGRLDTMQAAILLAKLKLFAEELDGRQQAAALYAKYLGGIDGLGLPVVPDNRYSAWAQYSVLCEDRDKVVAGLNLRGVPTAIYYPTPLHMLKVYKDLAYCPDDFPVSKKLSQNIFSLPMHPYLLEEHVAEIGMHISELLALS